MDGTPGMRRGSPRPWVPLVLILAAGALWRGLLFIGLTGYDDFAYAHTALDILNGRFSFIHADPRYAWRFLLTFPTALSFLLFGVNAASAVLFPYACSVLAILVTYLLGRSFLSEAAARTGALLMAVMPMSVVYSTMLFPEEVFALCAALGFWVFHRTETDRLPATAGYLLGGLCVVLAYLARETGLFLLLLFLLTRKKPLTLRHALLVLPIALSLGAELLISRHATGSFLRHYRELSGVIAHEYLVENQPYGFAVYLKGIFGMNKYGLAHFGFFYHAFLAGVVWLALRRRLMPLKPLLVWIGIFFLYYEFGSASFTTYVPVQKLYRYLSVLSIPVTLVLAHLITELSSTAKMKMLPKGLLLFLVATSLAGAFMASRRHKQQFKEEGGPGRYLEIARALNKHRPSSIEVPDLRWKYRLSTFWALAQGRRGMPVIDIPSSVPADCRVTENGFECGSERPKIP